MKNLAAVTSAVQTFAVLAVAIAIGVIGVMLWRWLQRGDGPASQIGNWLKDSPLGIPSRAIDSAISATSGGAARGGEDTLGGAFARLREYLSGDSDAIEAMKRGAPASQVIKPTDPYAINPRDRT